MATTTLTTPPTRRAMLGALAGVPMLAVAAPVAAFPTGSDFTAKLAEFDLASRRSDDHHHNVYQPSRRRYDELVAAIPHTTVEWQASVCFRGETWSTADQRKIENARYFLDPRHVRGIEPEQVDYHRACVELMAAHDARQAEVKRTADRLNLNAVVKRDDTLNDLRTDAIDAVIACPVATAPDLARKVEFAIEHDAWEYDHTRDAIAADVARLAARERH